MRDLISRFRANIITSGASAFEEEKWEEISIGSLHFQVSSGKFCHPSLRAAEGDRIRGQDGGMWEALSRRVCDICVLHCPLERPTLSPHQGERECAPCR